MPLIQKLDKCAVTEKFHQFIEVLSNGTLEIENIPLLLCLERAKLCKCKTTTLMRFHPRSKAFWRVAYRTWHGKGLLLMSGSKNRGQVCNKVTKLGYYKPDMASVNFAVPDVKRLFGDGTGLNKVINPMNCIEESFNLIDKKKQHVLVYDMKKVIRGFKGNKGGDEDMWSCEGPPTLIESYTRFQEELDILKDIKQQCEEKNLELLSFYCSRLINVISM